MLNQMLSGMMGGNNPQQMIQNMINPQQQIPQQAPQQNQMQGAYQEITQMWNQGMQPSQIIASVIQRKPEIMQTQLGPILNEMKSKTDINELNQYSQSVWPHISQQMGVK